MAQQIAENAALFGWGAPSFSEQFTCLDAGTAEHFDKDNEAIVRLHLRGLITNSARDTAFRKCTKLVNAAIAKSEGSTNA